MDTSNNTSQNNETNTESPNQKTTQVRNFIFCDLQIILKILIIFFSYISRFLQTLIMWVL